MIHLSNEIAAENKTRVCIFIIMAPIVDIYLNVLSKVHRASRSQFIILAYLNCGLHVKQEIVNNN